jgi:Zn-dependent peptidase ImmA (M78 family)
LAKNIQVKGRTAHDIDERIGRVLRGLGQPEPPLRLDDVRELLKLDRQFYSADDPSMLHEVVSRIRVATIQVAHRPMLLLEAIKKWSLQALYIPDRRRILLDGSLPEKKHRWSEAHEIAHSLIPWHDDVMHGDNRHTLLPHCQAQIEAEANYAAGRLLFLRDRFAEEARDLPPTIETVQSLNGTFGNTISSTLWRFVETVGAARPMVAMISGHPHVSRRADDFHPSKPCRHCIQSPAFQSHFSQVSEQMLFQAAVSYCNAKNGGPLGSTEISLRDDNGDDHVFVFETFFIRYRPPGVGEALTLGVYARPLIHAFVARQ